jgi:hypothetical protein
MDIVPNQYALSFSHATIRAKDKIYTAIGAVSISQDLTEGYVYGAGNPGPIKRTVGQMGIGVGQLAFTDIEEGISFWGSLSPGALQTIWELTYTLSRGGASDLSAAVGGPTVTKTIECISCRLTGVAMDHQAGPDPLGVVYPFTFMGLRIDGGDAILASLLDVATNATVQNLVKKLF